MSKIAEQKALKAYPRYYFFEKREGYIKGYDQAMQDLMEKAEKFFNNELYVSISDQICSQSSFTSMTKFIEQFKNYIQNESKD